MAKKPTKTETFKDDLPTMGPADEREWTANPAGDYASPPVAVDVVAAPNPQPPPPHHTVEIREQTHQITVPQAFGISGHYCRHLSRQLDPETGKRLSSLRAALKAQHAQYDAGRKGMKHVETVGDAVIWLIQQATVPLAQA